MSVSANLQIPGMELTKEPYRWDQRLFSVVFRIPNSVTPDDRPFNADLPRDNSPLDGFSCMTGGRSFLVDNMKWIDPVMMRISDAMQNGVMVRFEPLEEATFSTTSTAVSRMVYQPRHPQKANYTGHWPLPEPYLPEYYKLQPYPVSFPEFLNRFIIACCVVFHLNLELIRKEQLINSSNLLVTVLS